MGINILLIIITIISIFISIYCIKNKIKQDNVTKEYNNKLTEEKNKVSKDLNEVINKYNEKQSQKKELEIRIEEKEKLYDEIKNAISDQQSLSQKAFENYFEVLEQKYKNAEEEHDRSIELLQDSYSQAQLSMITQTDEIKTELEKLKATRTAAIEAARREREIKEQSSFYCLQISDQDKADIMKLNQLKPSLNRPRVLSMLEWSTFIQKPLKALGIKIVGSSDSVCGIYKITSLLSGECYIGQSVDVAQRFLEHGKCGMDVDRPQGNKLYSAMVRDGIWNFSFELLEECPREQLDEKEKFYIDLYNSYDEGYNSTRGNH